ncbi:FmdB family zinc ribbon protein [Nocardioides psychrotolerans]|uniref:FmdB family zinc ribbon protein n=1 Tax=Nocardioides psychrotolerans TaxID=1005945 RepID=UPI003137993A
MPTYQYACTECGHDFEQFQSFSDDALTECPQCQGRLRKVFNAVGVVFKGSGFYRTDSRSSSTASEPAASSSSSSGDSSSATSTTTETKTEKKADPKPSAPAPSAS